MRNLPWQTRHQAIRYIQVDNNSIALESVRVDGPVEGHLIMGRTTM